MKFNQNQSIYEDEHLNKKSGLMRPVWVLFLILILCLITYYFLFINKPIITNNDELPIIHYDHTPTKIKPKEPGGMVVPNMDKVIYDNLTTGEHVIRVERILPAPEEPIIIKQQEETTQELVAVENASHAQEKKLNDIDILELLEKDIGEVVEVTQPPAPTEEQAVEKSDEETTKEPKKEPKKEQLIEGVKVQLASFKNENDAISEWNRLKKKHPPLLGKYSYMIKKKNISDKGVFYCLQIGPFKNNSSARMLCNKLADINLGCLVVKE